MSKRDIVADYEKLVQATAEALLAFVPDDVEYDHFILVAAQWELGTVKCKIISKGSDAYQWALARSLISRDKNGLFTKWIWTDFGKKVFAAIGLEEGQNL